MRAFLSQARVYLLLVALVACGASQRESTIKAALLTMNTARDGFTTFSLEHQTNIVKAAKAAGKSKAEVQAEIAAFRDKRAVVIDLFAAAYHAIAAAAVLHDDAKSLDAITRAAALLHTALKDLKAAATVPLDPKPELEGVPTS